MSNIIYCGGWAPCLISVCKSLRMHTFLTKGEGGWRNKVEFSPKEFCLVPEKLILAYGHDFSVDLYIRLSGSKIIKLSHREDDIREAYLRYKLKGMKEAYVRADEFRAFVQLLKKKIACQQTASATGPGMNIDELDGLYMALKEITLKLGVDENTIELSKGVAVTTFKTISMAGNIYLAFQNFRKNCSEEFMSALMVTYISCSMLDKFAWSSLAIKEKLALAALLCDLTLENGDFEDLKKHRRDPMVNWENILNARVYNHPVNAAKLVTPFRSMVSTETLTVIEQHHENANGSGYPRRLHPSSINLLSAIFIIAEEFSYHLGFVDFDYRCKDDILGFMKKKYDKGNFKKAFEALISSMNESLEKAS